MTNKTEVPDKTELLERVNQSLGTELKDFVLRGLDASYALETLRGYLNDALKMSQIPQTNGFDIQNLSQGAHKVISRLSPEQKEAYEEAQRTAKEAAEESQKATDGVKKAELLQKSNELSDKARDLLLNELQKHLDIVFEMMTVDPEQIKKRDEVLTQVNGQLSKAMRMICTALGLNAQLTSRLSIEDSNVILTGVLLEEANRFDANIEDYVFIIPRARNQQSSHQ